jgi:hypothetical protein
MRKSFRTSVLALVAALATIAPVAPGRAAAPQKDNKNAMTKPTGTPVIWHDPGNVASLDFVGGPGGHDGAPKPPFTFVEEDLGGSNPKLKATDANGQKWGVKFGHEVNSEVFASRIAWAAGYYVDPSYYVGSGTFVGADGSKTKRLKDFIGKDGSFRDARFELKDKAVLKKFNGEEGWAWNSNPFAGTKELNGLKVILMLTSNWDSKDVRDISRGSNTAIYQVDGPNGPEARYVFTDWGGSMGKWGGVLGREKWDAKGYAKQTPDFIKGVKNGEVVWGYSGQRTEDVTKGIKVSDVKWITQYVGAITDDQLRAGLQSTGATPDEVEAFVKAIRDRINQLKAVQ